MERHFELVGILEVDPHHIEIFDVFLSSQLDKAPIHKVIGKEGITVGIRCTK